MKIEGNESIKIDQIKAPRLKEGSHVYIHSVYNRRDYHVLEVIESDSSMHDDKVEINLNLLKRIKNSNDPDSSIILKPYDLSKHRYGFVYKSIGDKTLKCLNVNNPKTTKYFPMVWDAEFIPEGIDSAITRIEDGVCGRGFIEKNGCMVIDLDNEQVVKADIEKFGFEKMIRINMLDIKSWDDYEFEYFDLDITNTLDVLEVFPEFFKSESDDCKSLKELIDKEEFEITELIRVRKSIKQEMMWHKDDPDKMYQLYKESMNFKHRINSKLIKYDDEFMKAMGVNKNE